MMASHQFDTLIRSREHTLLGMLAEAGFSSPDMQMLDTSPVEVVISHQSVVK